MYCSALDLSTDHTYDQVVNFTYFNDDKILQITNHTYSSSSNGKSLIKSNILQWNILGLHEKTGAFVNDSRYFLSAEQAKDIIKERSHILHEVNETEGSQGCRIRSQSSLTKNISSAYAVGGNQKEVHQNTIVTSHGNSLCDNNWANHSLKNITTKSCIPGVADCTATRHSYEQTATANSEKILQSETNIHTTDNVTTKHDESSTETYRDLQTQYRKASTHTSQLLANGSTEVLAVSKTTNESANDNRGIYSVKEVSRSRHVSPDIRSSNAYYYDAYYKKSYTNSSLLWNSRPASHTFESYDVYTSNENGSIESSHFETGNGEREDLKHTDTQTITNWTYTSNQALNSNDDIESRNISSSSKYHVWSMISDSTVDTISVNRSVVYINWSIASTSTAERQCIEHIDSNTTHYANGSDRVTLDSLKTCIVANMSKVVRHCLEVYADGGVASTESCSLEVRPSGVVVVFSGKPSVGLIARSLVQDDVCSDKSMVAHGRKILPIRQGANSTEDILYNGTLSEIDGMTENGQSQIV